MSVYLYDSAILLSPSPLLPLSPPFLLSSPPPIFSSQMCKLTAEDFKVTPELADRSWDYPPFVKDSPACCMEVYECSDFSIGIFLLKPKMSMPLHDHPGMHGVM